MKRYTVECFRRKDRKWGCRIKDAYGDSGCASPWGYDSQGECQSAVAKLVEACRKGTWAFVDENIINAEGATHRVQVFVRTDGLFDFQVIYGSDAIVASKHGFGKASDAVIAVVQLIDALRSNNWRYAL